MKKTCGFCENTDGMCYTSNPPKRKCTITGKFHAYDHICDIPQTNADRIRSMTNEELSELISFINSSKCCWFSNDCDKCFFYDVCKDEYTGKELEWLKQPVTENRKHKKLKTVLERNRRIYSEIFTEYEF